MPSATRFLLLAALAAVFGGSDSIEAGSVPITKGSKLALTREDGTVIFDNLAQSVSFTKNKYESTRANFQRAHGYPIPGTPKLDLSRANKRTTTIDLSPQSGAACKSLCMAPCIVKSKLILHCYCSVWSGNITLGKQNFRIDFDTGSAVSNELLYSCTMCLTINRIHRTYGYPLRTAQLQLARPKSGMMTSYQANLPIIQEEHSPSTMSMDQEYLEVYTPTLVSVVELRLLSIESLFTDAASPVHDSHSRQHWSIRHSIVCCDKAGYLTK